MTILGKEKLVESASMQDLASDSLSLGKAVWGGGLSGWLDIVRGDLMKVVKKQEGGHLPEPVLPKLRSLQLQAFDHVRCSDLGSFLVDTGCLSSLLELRVAICQGVAGRLEERHVQNLQAIT